MLRRADFDLIIGFILRENQTAARFEKVRKSFPNVRMH